MNLTFNQKLAFIVAALSFIAAGGSAADLVTLFGSTVAKSIAAAASLGAGLGGIFLGMVTGTANLAKDLQNTTGVESITLNEKAPPSLAKLALDPAQPKIDSAPGAEAILKKTAEGEGQ